ncbi:MAG TPA: cupin domain-containing protein [Chloroflexota bacterium]|nr:cupin domain-containing protein [Chloroflexota bacterium]
MASEPYFVDWEGRASRELFPGVRISVVSGEKLMLSRVELAPGSVVPEHQHPHEQFGFVMEGEATFTVGNETRQLVKGDYYAIPGGVLHRVDVGDSGAVCMDIFSPPREEYR